MHVVMVAAENDALPGGKVGGLGDVIRDLPVALAAIGHQVTVIMPGYGHFSELPGARYLHSVNTEFCGQLEDLALFAVAVEDQPAGVEYRVLEHPLFSAHGKGKIYFRDSHQPFATDAHKFALFSSAVGELLLEDALGPVDVLHCHDWHAAALLWLRRFSPHFQPLSGLRTVYTIHNLSLQGLRPFRGTESSLENWFRGFSYSSDLITDTRFHDCVNLMRIGINFADRVSTVSPTYAEEILRPSDWEQGIVGGEGLEQDLARIAREGRLVGILNGCDYSAEPVHELRGARLWQLIEDSLDAWVRSAAEESNSYYFALKAISRLRRRRKQPGPLLVSVGRLAVQKLDLLMREHEDRPVIDHMLARLGDGLFILLGSGDPQLDEFFTACMMRNENFIYLCGYSDVLANTLYSSGELFVMPSIYEPCGISQMLAMRVGQPCFVHQVGGLNDTVIDGETGFSFGGDDLEHKLTNLLACFERALETYEQQPQRFRAIGERAAKQRFDWKRSAEQYVSRLYSGG